LTQKVERSQAYGLNSSAGGALPKREAGLDLRSFMRRPTSETAAVVPAASSPAPAPAPTAPAAVPSEPPQRQSDVAFSLLEQAAAALPALLDRCRALEADLVVAGSQTREWQQKAAATALKVESLEKTLDAMRQRAEAAEQQAAAVTELAAKSQHQAAEAECLSSLFHDKVVTAFGIGSPAHGVLEAVKARTAP
jgi:hypothetical protein